jgi:hypothetical protein
VVALACQLPAATGVPLSRWTGPELLAEITRAGTGDELSASSVLRILAEHPVKPWQYQSWISPRDPDFAARASVILDLYQRFYQGRRLRPGDRILSVDAKPSIQARGRCRPASPAGPGKPVRMEHEYVRHGALALLAALDVRTGKVFAATPATTGIAPFMDLMTQVMSQPPYKDAPRVFVIVDNGSDHRGQAAVKRLHDAWPNAIMIHTPVHASWLNQAEIFFSSPRRKSSRPTTLPAWMNSPAPCMRSSASITRPPGRSTGSSPPQTWPGSSTGSAPASTLPQKRAEPPDAA